jgi:DNA-binding CsgD family transcriptional regulator
MTGARAPIDPARDQLQRRLARATSQARAALTLPDDDEDGGRTAGAVELGRLIGALEERVAAEPPGGQEEAAAHAAELERLHSRHRARAEALAAVDEAVGRLRSVTSPADMLSRAPRALCEASGLTRVVLSVVRDGLLVADAVHFRDDRDGAVAALAALGASAPRLQHPLIETELLRRRRATIVADAQAHPRVHRPWAAVMGWRSYVAAPLVVHGHVTGLVHADTSGTDRALDVLDGDVLWAFAGGLAEAYETASLRRSIRRQRKEMQQFLEWLGAESIELSDAPMDLAPGPDAPLAPPGRLDVVPSSRGLDDRAVFEHLLSRRQLDVLRLLARGESNAAIAAELVIAEATVKSHVAGILRKLRVHNRAEAVARYHRLVRRVPDGD